MSEIDKLIDTLGNICHEQYQGSTYDRQDESWSYAYANEVVNMLDDDEARKAIKALILNEVEAFAERLRLKAINRHMEFGKDSGCIWVEDLDEAISRYRKGEL